MGLGKKKTYLSVGKAIFEACVALYDTYRTKLYTLHIFKTYLHINKYVCVHYKLDTENKSLR